MVRTERHRAGLIVDSVSEVLRCCAADIEPAPDLTNEAVRLVHGVINLEKAGRIVLLLDPAELLTRAERGLLDAFQAKTTRASAVTRVLVVDDSALMRKLLGKIFSTEADFEVQFARNGLEALALLDVFKPDVVTLDIHMPQMDGLACLDRIMVERPCPVVMVSSLTADGADDDVGGAAARRDRLRRQARGRDLAAYRGAGRRRWWRRCAPRPARRSDPARG